MDRCHFENVPNEGDIFSGRGKKLLLWKKLGFFPYIMGM